MRTAKIINYNNKKVGYEDSPAQPSKSTIAFLQELTLRVMSGEIAALAISYADNTDNTVHSVISNSPHNYKLSGSLSCLSDQAIKKPAAPAQIINFTKLNNC